MFSIIIPTYNNLEYLKILIESIKQNSKFNNEIIIHVNEGTDGSLDYVKKNNFLHTYSSANIGLCSATNKATNLAETDYILYSHDDMYFLPNWDFFLLEEINKVKNDLYYFSGTTIGPLGCGLNGNKSISELTAEEIKNLH